MITPDSFEQFSREISGAVSGNREVTSRGLTTLAVAGDAPFPPPERALAAGVLHQASADLRRFRNAKDAVGREMHADAYAWFVANDTDWPYSFVNVCEVLGLSPDAVLDEVCADAQASWYSHSRRIVRRLATSAKGSLTTLFAGRREHSFAAANS